LRQDAEVIFGPKRRALTGGWRKLHNEELHNLYCTSNVIKVIRSRRMRWEEQETSVEEMRKAYEIIVGKPEGKWPLRRHSRRWGIILEWILKPGRMWTGFIWLKIESRAWLL
jgi:hypothetical protein